MNNAPKIDLNPIAQTTGEQPQFATILGVHFGGSVETTDDGKIALPADITYRVAINSSMGPIVFDTVVPAHRRGSANVKVIAAQPKDKCLVCWEGNTAYFIIFEPPYFKVCTS